MLQKQKTNADSWGIFTSILCAFHCAFLPLLAGSLPIFAAGFIYNALFEWGMIGLAFIIGFLAMWRGFSRRHRRITPGLLFLAGMCLLIAKQLWHGHELRLLPFAVVFIISAHVINHRWSHLKIHPDSLPLHFETPKTNVKSSFHPGIYKKASL